MKIAGPSYQVPAGATGGIDSAYEDAMDAQNATGYWAPREQAPAAASASASNLAVAQAPVSPSRVPEALLSHANAAGMGHQEFLNAMFGDGHTLNEAYGTKGDPGYLFLDADSVKRRDHPAYFQRRRFGRPRLF